MGLFNARYTEEEKRKFEESMLEMIPEGIYIKEMAERLGIGVSDAHTIKNKLINEGRTSQAKIDKAVEERRNKEKREKLLNDPDIQKVKEGLLAGLSAEKISRTVNFSRSRINQLEKILQEAGIIDKQAIEIAKQNRGKNKQKATSKLEEQEINPEEYLNKKKLILHLLNIGISTKQIRNLTGITLETFRQMKKELIEEGLTSEALIKDAVEKRENEAKDVIEFYIKEGYNLVEIAEKIPYADRVFVGRLLKQLKAEGRVTDEEITAGIEKRENELNSFILGELEKGFISSEIAENEQAKALKLTKVSIRDRINKLKNNGDITQEDEEKFKMARKTMQEGNKKTEILPYDKKIMRLTDLGFSTRKIMQITGLSSWYLFSRKRVLKEMGLIKREDTSELVRDREKMADERRKSMVQMITFDKDLDSSIINNHIEYAKAMFELGQIEMRDIDLISTAIPMEYKLMSLDNINFVIKYFNDKDELRKGVNFINKCLETANDDQDKKRRKLLEMKEGLERKMREQEKEKKGFKERRNNWIDGTIKANPPVVGKSLEENIELEVKESEMEEEK